MPNGQSSYSAYREAGRSKGEYQASLQSIEDVLTQREFKRVKGAIRSEKTERTLDTLMAMIETGSTLYGGYLDKQEFEGYLGDVSEIKGPYQKVGKEDKLWGEMSWWDKTWQEPKYKFGEDVLGKEDITIMAKMKKYGMDIETDYTIEETSPGGKFTAVVGEGKEVEIGGGSMYEEELKVGAELEEPLPGGGELEMGAEKEVEFPILKQSEQYKAFNPFSYGEGEEDDDPLNFLKILESGGGH